MKLDNFVHVVQSAEWGEFKTLMGTKAFKVGDLQFTKHKIPKLPYYIAYAPKVNFLKQNFNWDELKKTAKNENCVMVRFDVPNIVKNDFEEVQNLLNELNNKCEKSPRSTFSKHNVILTIDESLENLLSKMSQKTRYNIKLAEKKGVKIVRENNEKGVEIFNRLMKETAARQGFLPHSSAYYKKCFETLNKHNMANILIAYYTDESKNETLPLAAWMLFNKDNVLYYPYGTSSNEHRNLMPSNLLAWEAIKLGKELNCTIFDMWGADNDETNSWWGFTKFKLGYGGQLVEYIDSYDFVIEPPIYKMFNLAYAAFWKLKKIILKVRAG